MGGQRGQLDTRLGEIAAQLAEGDTPVETLEQQRQLALAERVRAEQTLAQARSALEGVDAGLREYEQVRHQRDEQAITQREAIAQRRLDQQALVIHAEQLAAAVVEAGFVLEDVVAGLAEDAEVEAAGKQVRTSTTACAAWNRSTGRDPGPCRSRAAQEYLDYQDADLTRRSTPRGRIRKIDASAWPLQGPPSTASTRRAEIYPRCSWRARLPGADGETCWTPRGDHGAAPGQARVEHLAAVRGEKAMNRGGAVFAIFQLNPRPFCLLDEVDAPLDEATSAASRRWCPR